jgi:hypothetical protein
VPFNLNDAAAALPLAPVVAPARWHVRAHAAAFALPASVKTELDGCVAAGVFSAAQVDDAAVDALARAGAELATMVLGQLDGTAASPSAQICELARALAQLVQPHAAPEAALPAPPPAAYTSPPLLPPMPMQAPPLFFPQQQPHWAASLPQPVAPAAPLPPTPSWLPASLLPSALHVAPPPPNPRVRELTEELARVQLAHAAEVEALNARLRDAHAELEQLRARCAQQPAWQ